MAQLDLDTQIEKSAESAVGKLLRQGVYFEQMIEDLRLHFHKRKVLFIYDNGEWYVRHEKDVKTRRNFGSFAQAIEYAYGLCHAE
jgi:hypothetical protein